MARAPTAASVVVRSRLLSRLPDAPGFVVHLLAPCGFGKTWLAREHLRALEAGGWRTFEVSPGGRPVREVVAAAVGGPAGAPLGALLEALWRTPTALLLDDLGPDDASDPSLERLLAKPGGLLLLASRGPLATAELGRARAEGRLLSLRAEELAFDLNEATALFGGDREKAAAALGHSAGWPLLMAHAAATGEALDARSVAAAVREALPPADWEALLLLAAVPDARPTAVGESAERLVTSGFATRSGGSVRLMDAVAEACLGACRDQALRVLDERRADLSLLQLGRAFEELDELGALAALLDAPEGALEREDPQAVLRWHRLLGGGGARRQGHAGAGGAAQRPRGEGGDPPDALQAPHAQPTAMRLVRVGNALVAVGRGREGAALLESVAADDGLPADLRLRALGDAIYALADEQGAQAMARELLAGSSALVALASPERRGLFYSTASVLDFRAGDLQAAKRLVERALAEVPAGSPYAFAPLINLSVLEWNLSGDLEGRIRLQTAGLEICRAHYPDHVVGVCRDLAHLSLYLGRTAEARAYLGEARGYGAARPVLLLDVEAMLAALDGDLPRLRELAATAAASGDPSVADAVAWRYLGALRRSGAARLAVTEAEALRPLGGFATVALALAHLELGAAGEASSLLEAVRPTGDEERELKLEWTAARYLASRDEADLSGLLALTTSGAAVLPALLPLQALPRHRPELARAYPLQGVLRSGWREAVELRLPELPPLEVGFLGETSVTLLGERAEVHGRPRDLLALLLLRMGRREIGAALWPEASAGKVRNNLGVQYSLLRRVLEPWGIRRYLPDDALVHARADVWRLEEALHARDAEHVIAVYRGPFAPQVDVPAVADARTRLERAVVDLLVESSATAPPERAVHYLRRALEIDPLDEEAVQALLRRLVASGRASEAEQRYRRFEADLRRELGAEPRAETRAVLGR